MLAALACASLGACENRQASPAPATAQPTSDTTDASEPTPPLLGEDLTNHCPMGIEGASVAAEDTADGIALDFAEGTGDREDLRVRVLHMASMYEAHAGHGPMMWHHMGHMRDEGYQPGMGSEMPAVSTRVEDTQAGVRLVLTPRDPTQLENLRLQVRDHQKHMTAGECWMPE